MKRGSSIVALCLCLCLVTLRAADPAGPVLWTAKQLADFEKNIRSSVDPARHLGIERLLDSATLIYRDGPSEAEVHQKLADFIVVRQGAGAVMEIGRAHV